MQWIEAGILSVFILYVIFVTINIFILLANENRNNVSDRSPSTPTTIIIPARNEEHNIIKCLESIAAQNFPKELLQVIVVDDSSSDNTHSLSEKFLKNNFTNYNIFKSSLPGKKTAILQAMQIATGKIIITRDADTYTTSTIWLKNIVGHFGTSNCDLLISPTILSGNNSFLSTFEKFENLAIVSLGASMTKIKMPFVCSGANLAYKKEVFLNIEPYKDNLNVASGDDMFLLKYFYKAGMKIESNNVPEAAVFTPAESSFQKMLSQRLRWASKTGKINTVPVLFTGLLVLIVNLLTLPVLCLGFINSSYWWFSLFTLTLKFIIDFLLLFLSTRMYQQRVNWFWLPFAFLFNSMYVPLVVGASVFVKPTWKSRHF
ncbi:MAG: glycosyltransferase [Bacteroidia bacterium]